eukprot:Platyproteum_vivax@DN4197_c0_g1_i4.p1
MLTGATWLFLLTDVDCLYSADPRTDNTAKPLYLVERISDLYKQKAGTGVVCSDNSGSGWGTGGMQTKILAAKVATSAGVHTGLLHGQHPERVTDLIGFGEAAEKEKFEWAAAAAANATADIQVDSPEAEDAQPPVRKGSWESGLANFLHPDGQGVVTHTLETHTQPAPPYIGTIFRASANTQSIRHQRRWVLSLPIAGKLFIDKGAARAVTLNKKSLLAAGIVAVEGDFCAQECVGLYRAWGDNSVLKEEVELARCLVNFASDELELIKGKSSSRVANEPTISEILGYVAEAEVAFRSNIIIVDSTVDGSISQINGDIRKVRSDETGDESRHS